MPIYCLKRLTLLAAVLLPAAFSAAAVTAQEPPPSYDISWPQCPATLPSGAFEFAIIGLTGGRPFTSNECFPNQYEWAKTAEAHPDVYINLDFPREGRVEAENGPYGRCESGDLWCRAYNYGHALGRDAHFRAASHGVQPGRIWFDVEMDNHWSDWGPNNAQVVHGALDYFDSVGVPVGLYGTSYQWGLITAGYVPLISRPLWLAGASTREGAHGRCEDSTLAFAAGEIWLVQYPEAGFDGNVRCAPAASVVPPAPVVARPARSSRGAPLRTLHDLDIQPEPEFVRPPSFHESRIIVMS